MTAQHSAADCRSVSRHPAWPTWIAVALVGVAGLVYLPTLSYDFAWDDQMLITENRNLATSNPLHLFGETFWPSPSGEGYYRPLVTLSFWFERHVWGLNPTPFHLTNVLLNCLASALAALVLARLFRRQGDSWLVLMGGLAFALHPAHVESVAFVCGRTDLMMAVFLLAALLLVFRYREKPQPGAGVGIVAAFVAALLCKEASVVFPALVLLCLLPSLRRRSTWCLVGSMLVAAIGYVVLRSLVIAGARAAWTDETTAQRILVVLNAIGRYAFLSVVPFSHRLLSAGTESFARPGWPTLVGLVSLAGIGFLATRFRDQPLRFGGVWFALLVLPGSNILPIGVTLLAERLLYLPVLGTIVVASAGLLCLPRVKPVSIAMVVAVSVYAVLLGWNTLQRMPVWKNNGRLYAQMVKEAPDSPQAHYNLATVLDQVGNDSGAIEEYGKAISLGRDFPQAYNNLGTVRLRGGDIQGAIAEFYRALAIDSTYASAYYNLAGALSRAGDTPGAIRACRRALHFDPELVPALRNLARTLLETGDIAGAVEEYRKAAALEPGDADLHYSLAGALQEAGDLPGAVAELRRAIALQPDMAAAHNDLGITLERAGDTAGSLAEFRRAVELGPDDALAHANLGSMLRNLGDYDGALVELRRAVELDPSLEQARLYLEEMTGRSKERRSP